MTNKSEKIKTSFFMRLKKLFVVIRRRLENSYRKRRPSEHLNVSTEEKNEGINVIWKNIKLSVPNLEDDIEHLDTRTQAKKTEKIRRKPKKSLKKLSKKLRDTEFWVKKGVYLIVILFGFSYVIGGVSVIGLLQSNEDISASGVLVRPAPPPPPKTSSIPPPPEPEVDIDVYQEPQCVNKLTNIDWGAIIVGSSKTKTVYIKNSGDSAVKLSLITENWNPVSMADHLTLSWDYDSRPIRSNTVQKIRLTLIVSPQIQEVGSFKFDITFIGTAL